MSPCKLHSGLLGSLAALLLTTFACGEAPYHLLIRNGTVIDGTEGRKADVGIRDGKVARVGDPGSASSTGIIDASGLVVAPGFIDIHNHSDNTILVDPRAESMVRQGVTTMILGESGSAGPVVGKASRELPYGLERDWTTLGGYFERLEKQGIATNVASYVGQGQVWTCIVGYENRRPSNEELEEMKKLLAQAMQEGALGLSTSLLMPPWSLATTDELVALAKVAQGYGGIYSTHIRDEGEGVFDAVKEAIAVGREASIPVDIIHLKIAHKDLWGRMEEVVALIEEARQEGLNIQANVYPYTAGQNNLRAIIPPWAHDGGNEMMLERLKDPAMRIRIRRDILSGLPGWYNHYSAPGGWDRMLLVSFSQPKNKPFQGKRMSELIEARGEDGFKVLFDVLREENGSVRTVYFHHTEADMQLALKQPWTSVGSDGTAVRPDGVLGQQNPHPRYYGTFPRLLGRYVNELKVLTLPEAIHKITGMNAEKIGIHDRGRIEEGRWADVTIFDSTAVRDQATFEEPNQYPLGIVYVIVNGKLVLERGRPTGALPGKVLYGPGKSDAGS